MKKTALLFILFYAVHTFGQNIPSKEQSPATENQSEPFKVAVVWRLYPIASLHFGDNVFAKAHDNGGGFGTSLGLLKYNSIRAGIGYEFTSYSVSDVSQVGNFNNSNVQSFNYFVSYDFPLTEKLLFAPNIGYGNDFVNQKTATKRFGHYSGHHFKIGVLTDWELSNSIACFVGIHYINSKYDIKTNAMFENYVQQSHQLQLSLGLKIY